MHIISDCGRMRAGYTYQALPGGGWAGLPKDNAPRINWKHIDGPLLYTSTGRLHWLTAWERIKFSFGFETIETLDQRRS